MKKILSKLQTILICTIFFLNFIPLNGVKAASDFEITSNYNVQLTEKEYATVTEELVILVNNPNYYYPAGTKQTFLIQDYTIKKDENERKFKKDSLKVTDKYGSSIKYTTTDVSSGINVVVPFTSAVNSFNSYTIKLSYNTHELVSNNGNITNVYVPGLANDIKFVETENGLTTSYTYNAKVITPNSFPLPSHIQPSSISVKNESDRRIYTIKQEDRIGHTSWLQLGSSQYYHFKIVQETPKTDDFTPKSISDIAPIVSTNIYKLALPREFDETAQKVFFKSLTPTPKSVIRDQEGNLFATFEVPANQDFKIEIEGYISLFKDTFENTKTPKNITLEEYFESVGEDETLNRYLTAQEYWEVEDEVIVQLADTLSKDQKNIIDLIRKDYTYIVDKFDYSFEKIESGNPRVGAKEALLGAQTICMEYSDSLISFLRAQGIPARAAIGYGNDPTGAENNISNDSLELQNIGHQWVQVWIPDYGWLSVDPTWGESDREYIGSDLDHILWYTVGKNNDGIVDTTLLSADSLKNQTLTSTKVYIQALDQEKFDDIDSKLSTSESLIEKYSESESGLDTITKTSIVGRILIYLTPIFVTILLVFTTITIFKVLARLKKRNIA